MDSITSAVNKAIYDAISTYTNSLIDNGLLTCSFDIAISHFNNHTIKKKKSKPDVIKSLPMWTPHHFDTCIALVGDCMAQCSLSKTQGQFCTACSKKCGDDGIPPNGTIFTRTSYQYTAPNGKSPKPFIDSSIYKKKIKDGQSPSEIRKYYEDLHFDISPLNWGDLFDSSDNSAAEKPPLDKHDKSEKAEKAEKAEKGEKGGKKKSAEKSSDDSDKSLDKSLDKPVDKKKGIEKKKLPEKVEELTCEDPDLPEIPNAIDWSFKGTDYLAVNLSGGDKNIYDIHSHHHIGIFNSRSNRIILY